MNTDGRGGIGRERIGSERRGEEWTGKERKGMGRRGLGGYLFSSMTCFRSGGGVGTGWRMRVMRPSSDLRRTMLNLAYSSDLVGKSSRNWAPRDSLRSMAARVTASETVRRLWRSMQVCQPGLYS